MRFLIKTISGRQGYKSFKTLNEYVDFMTNKGHLIQDLKEADLPYTDKPVKLPKVSKSNGWSEVSDFGGVGEEPEKGESLIASTSKSVMKDEASFEMSKSSGKADKPEMGLGAEKGDVDMSDFKSFEYEEPKLKSSETKESTPKSEEPKSEEKSEPKKEESKEDKKDSNESSKKEEKKDDSKKHDKDIEECLRAAGVQLDEAINDIGIIREKLQSLNDFNLNILKEIIKGLLDKGFNKEQIIKFLNRYSKGDVSKYIKWFAKELNKRWDDNDIDESILRAYSYIRSEQLKDEKEERHYNHFEENMDRIYKMFMTGNYTLKQIADEFKKVDLADYGEDCIEDWIRDYLYNSKIFKESFKSSGKQLNEFFKMDAPEEEFKSWKRDVNPERPYIKWDDKAFQNACEKIGLNNFLKECRRFFHQSGGSNTKANFLSLINGNKNIDEIIEIIKDNCDEITFKKFQNYIRDRLFLRYLNEGERWDKFKDSVHNLGVKAKQGLGLGMNDEVLESYGVGYLADVFLAATKHITPDDAGFQDTANRIIKTDSKMKNLHSKIMKFLQDKTYDERFDPQMMEGITRRFLTQLGIDEDIINQAYEDYKEEIGNNQKFDESDDGFDDEIAECLKSAGVQLNEFFHFDGPDPDDESKESDDEKTYKKYMKKEISDDEARTELKKQGWKGKKAKNAVKNAKSKRDGK